jgi:hypothetical protein
MRVLSDTLGKGCCSYFLAKGGSVKLLETDVRCGSKPVILTASRCLPLFTQQRTCSDHGDTSDLCQKATLMYLLQYVCFSNRPFGVKHFQTIHLCGVDVARGLVLLSGIGTWALVWGFLCQGVRQGGEAFLRRFFGSISKPVSSSRPARR